VYCKEITGIHIGENSLEYSNLKKELKGWIRSEPAIYSEISGRNGLERLESLLTNLKPKRTRRICISIPRSRYFLRELSFPGLSPEEAENSVRIAINIHSHLPRDEIYFDIWPMEKNGTTFILLAYARRTYIDPILDVVRRTGHRKSLYSISPSGLGADLFLRWSKHNNFPALSLQQEERDLTLNLHGNKEWEGSHLIREESGTLNPSKALEFLPDHFKDLGQVFQIGDIDRTFKDLEIKDPCKHDETLKGFCTESGIDKGLTACFLGLSAYPQISFQETERKKPLFLRIDPIQWTVAILAIILLLITGYRFIQLERLSSVADKNKEVVTRLEKEYLPLKKINDQIEKIRKLEQDLNDFLHERPPVLVILRELAQRTPLNAWIRSCTIRSGVVRVSAEGGSAVETMEEWRKSALFSEVKLVSPVTKNRQQQERYTVELKLATKTSATVPNRHKPLRP